MKNFLLTIGTLVLLCSCTTKKPIDYYNKAVYAGNMAIGLNEMESRIERIQEGIAGQPIDLVARTNMRRQANENYLNDMKNFLGNEDSDSMIQAAIAYLEYDIESIKNQKTIALLNEIDNALTPEGLQKVLELYEPHLDSIYDTKAELFDTYDIEVAKYAKAHDIEEKFYGPNLQPVEKEE